MALNLDTLGLSATVTAEGISAPDYQTILDTLTSYFQQIYGSDAYLEPDSKDGQMVALVALAIHDANNTAISVYNCFSPAIRPFIHDRIWHHSQRPEERNSYRWSARS